MPSPPPRSRCSSGNALGEQLAREIGDRLGAPAPAARAVVICDPTCTCRPTTCRLACAGSRGSSSRSSSIDMPNLVAREPVEMCGWLPASTSGLIAHGDARHAARRPRPAPAIRSISPDDSALMAPTPRPTARVELVARLADAGEDDLAAGGSRRAARLRSRPPSWRRPRRRARACAGRWPSVEFALIA